MPISPWSNFFLGERGSSESKFWIVRSPNRVFLLASRWSKIVTLERIRYICAYIFTKKKTFQYIFIGKRYAT